MRCVEVKVGLFLLCFTFLHSAIASADDFEFHGYMRSGTGASSGGTDQTCFKAAGATGKYRLGNECETYIETSFANVFKKDDSATAPALRANITLAFISSGHRDFESNSTSVDEDGEASQELTTALREAFVSSKNIMGDSLSLWVGKRFYRRHDVHMLDYYYLNNSGPGVGVEGIPAGIGKAHFAVIRNVPKGGDDDGPAQTNMDLRLSDVSFPGGGNLTSVLIYGESAKRSSTDGAKKWENLSGYQLGFIHNQPNLLGGSNKFVLQYGSGIYGADAASEDSALSKHGGWGSQNIAKGDSDSKSAREDSMTLRFIEQLVIKPMDLLSLSFVVLYQDTDFGGAKKTTGEKIPAKKELSLGLRPLYHIGQNYDLAFELAHTQVKNGISTSTDTETSWKDSQMQKITIAPQLTMESGYWARPQLRLFATWAKWNDASKPSVGSPRYASHTSGWSAGAQFEAWW